jgi:multicomponent K+:H+ antiporter subunit G
MTVATPHWVDAVTAVLVLVGAVAALIGSIGLLRLDGFFRRVHAPTLGTTLGTWALTAATVWQASFVSGQPFIHAILIAVFVALTAPVTAVLLMRAALFRARVAGEERAAPEA